MYKSVELPDIIDCRFIFRTVTQLRPKATGPIDMLGGQIPLPKAVATAIEDALKARQCLAQRSDVVALAEIVAKAMV